MFRSQYKLTGDSTYKHPYLDEIFKLQNELFSAITVGLLKRVLAKDYKLLEQNLNTVLDSRNWNKIKTLKEFSNRKNSKLIGALIDLSRRILLFRSIISTFSRDTGSLSACNLAERILELIPESLSVEFLEELLDRFMEAERDRSSPDADNPILLAFIEAKTNGKASIGNVKEEYSAEILEEEIKNIQVQSRIRYSHLSVSGIDHKNEGGATVSSELSKFIHSILVNLYNSKNKELLDYINAIEANSELSIYTNRPIYKLILRARNVLILSNIKQNSFFSKDGIKNVVDHLAKLIRERIEIGLVLNILSPSNSQEEHVQALESSVYSIICMIQNKIRASAPVSIAPEHLQNADFDPEQAFIQLLNKHIFNPYTNIPKEDILVNNLEEIYAQVKNHLLFTNKEKITAAIGKIFFEVANKIASLSSCSIDKEVSHRDFFSDNSSNPLLEFTRIFLSHVETLARTKITSLTNMSLEQSDNFSELYSYLRSELSFSHTWTICFPIEGIKVEDDYLKAFFHNISSSICETHNIKFLSSNHLTAFSREASSSLSQPVSFHFDGSDGGAVITDIQAGDSYQAGKIAIDIVQDVIESQFYLMRSGHQHYIKPFGRSFTTTYIFHKKVSRDTVDQSWSFISLSKSLRVTCNFELSNHTEKFFTLPARLFKILSDRAKLNNSLQDLARNLIHCLKLYREGYFSEKPSERFRIYWTILDVILSPQDVSKTEKYIIPYRAALLCLGVQNLLKEGDVYTYKQARMWMREDIEDIYTFIRNPLIHQGIEYAPAYEGMLKRVEDIVFTILRLLVFHVTYMDIPKDFLDRGLDGILYFYEKTNPSTSQIYKNMMGGEESSSA